MNKKSVYRHVTFKDKDTNLVNNDTTNNNEVSQFSRETKNKILAEKIVSQNLNENIGEIQEELTKVSEHIKNVVTNCE